MNPAQTAAADQAHAAVTEAAAALLTVGDHTGAPVRPTAAFPWLLDATKTLARAVHTGTATYCPHAAPGAPAGVYHAAAWAPGHITCHRCAPAHLAAAGVEANTCDRCRRYVTAIHSGLAQVGPVLLAFGICNRCRTADDFPA